MKLIALYRQPKDTLKDAMRSPEMSAAGENLNSFAKGLVSMLFGEEEMAPGSIAGTTVSAAAV